MDGYNIYPGPELRGKTPWPLVASSLWLRLGFVGATGAVVALIELYKGEADLLAALAWIFGGAWLTALSWRRAKILLDRLDGVDGAAEAVAIVKIAKARMRIQNLPPPMRSARPRMSETARRASCSQWKSGGTSAPLLALGLAREPGLQIG